jgi:3-hydroxyisobutyrate dehydrogenase
MPLHVEATLVGKVTAVGLSSAGDGQKNWRCLMRIGFIGLGNMGGPMALNVMKAGHTMVVNDIRREMAAQHLRQGATWADTPKAVAEQSELIFTSLPGPREVEAVALGENGIFDGAAPGSIYADLSTSSATLIRQIHGKFREKGIHVLDAPVSGGASGARRASLAVMVGGDETLYQQIKPVLDAIGDKVTYIGEIGCGTIAKIVHNMVSLCSRVAIAEGLTLGVKAGVSPRALLDAIQRGSFGQGRVLKESIHVPMMVAGLVEQQMEEALRRGLADKDSSAIFLLQEERAGVQVRDPQGR